VIFLKTPTKFGKYFLFDRINIGGMAEVFRAKTFGVEGFEKLLAIKRILPNIAEDEDFITMFIDEAKIAVQLNHANIAQIYDLGKIDDSYFIALEYVSGKDLRTIWERHRKHNLLFPIPVSVYIMIRACEGLDYAHRKKDAAGRDLNIVHRDVSPQNVLVSYEGEIKLIDFGIAKAANKVSKTQAGILKGKFGYMSPEQVRGLPLDRRSDIFAAGIILYELLTNERLFEGDSDFSTLEKVRNVEILPPSTFNRNISEALEKIVMKALAKETDDRFSSAYDMQEELQKFLILSNAHFSRKDLAAYMKRAFKGDIEREMSRLVEYQTFKPDPDLAAALAAASSQETPQRRKTTGVSGRVKVAAPATKPVPVHVPSLAADDEDDEDVETVISDQPFGEPDQTPALPVNVSSDLDLPAFSASQDPADIDNENTSESIQEGANAIQALLDDELGSSPDVLAGNPNPLVGAASLPSPAVEALPTQESSVREDWSDKTSRSRVGPLLFWLVPISILVLVLVIYKFSQQSEEAESANALTIISEPTDAEIWLDGVAQGKERPLVLKNLNVGSHLVEVKKDAYLPYQEKIEITGKENKTLNVAIRSASSELTLLVDPPNAEVSLDGKPLQKKSPVSLPDLMPDVEHVFTFSLAGFETKNLKLTLKPKEKRQEKVVLSELFFDIEVNSDPQGAKLFLDDNARGTTPATLRKLSASRYYRLALKHPSHADWTTTLHYDGNPILRVKTILEKNQEEPRPVQPPEKTAKVEKGKSDSSAEPRGKRNPTPTPPAKKAPPAVAAKPTGKLTLQSVPWGNVWIDGKDMKVTTPLIDYDLPAGKHSITLHLANGETKSLDVEIVAGEGITKAVKAQ
jgi:eukaryotic-like serine/threonine-protein kinase